MRLNQVTFFTFLLAFVSIALALRIEIEEANRLELRNVHLPNGTETTLYVISGDPATISFGDQKIIGNTIEFDVTHRVLRVVGLGIFVSGKATSKGRDLELVLDDELFTGSEVSIVTSDIDVYGDSASRVPGQISVMAGRFSPCSRCSQIVEDYGFRANRIELFPGDRLVAFGVTVLIRGNPFFYLPVMVLPLAGAELSPQVSLVAGNTPERAQLTLEWPYVSGANAFGKFSIHYFADVAPTNSDFLVSAFLGGKVRTSYLGGGVLHRFFTETGRGEAELVYTPSFVIPDTQGEKTKDLFRTRLHFLLDGSSTLGKNNEFFVERDDVARNRIVQYLLRASASHNSLESTFTTQGFLDLEPNDGVEDPTYDNFATPRKTLTELALSPTGLDSLSIGKLGLQELKVAIGVFEDDPHPGNRELGTTEYVTAARILEGHTLELSPIMPWKNFQLAGTSTFAGRYYDTGERLIDWYSQIEGTQLLGEAGHFSVIFRRDIAQGQTPFLFDQTLPSAETSLDINLKMTPLDWLDVTVGGGYEFQNSRSPRAVGFNPLITRLNFFQNSSWLKASLTNEVDLKGDPGTVIIHASLQSVDDGLPVSLDVDHVQDLKVEFGDDNSTRISATETRLRGELGVGGWFTVALGGGYTYAPSPANSANSIREFWNPLEINVEAGTLRQDDRIPGLGLGYSRDLNTGLFSSFSYELSGRVGPISFNATESFYRENNKSSIGLYQVIWPSVASLKASGFNLLQPSWLSLPIATDTSEIWSVVLRDAPHNGEGQWKLTYRTQSTILTAPVDPSRTSTRGLRNSELETRFLIKDVHIVPFRFGVDFFTELLFRDHERRFSFLRSGKVDLQLEILNRIGVQGAFGFVGTFDQTNGNYTRSQLTITDFAFTVRANEDLYIGAILNDVWDFSTAVRATLPWNFQPKVFVVVDRCCWGFYAHWDTETGQVRLALGAAGSGKAFIQNFDTPLFLPGRQGRP